MNIMSVLLLGLAAGVLGTGGGGLIAVFTHQRVKLPLSGLLGLSAGVMLAVVFQELIPEAVEDGGLIPSIVGLLSGVIIMIIMDYLVPHEHLSNAGEVQPTFVRAGLLLGLGIAFHNFPEGIAIGTSYAHNPELGYAIAVVLALHNLPEGIAMAIPLSAGHLSPLRVVLYTMAAGVPMGIGAFIGGWLGVISPLLLSVGLGFAAGAMLYITCHELVPGAQSRSRGYAATLGIVIGVIIGVILLGHH